MTREDDFTDNGLLNLTGTELGQRYQVRGRFYSLKGKAKVYFCRDVLELHRDEVQQTACDAIFVMMNPGSSKLLDVMDTDVNIATMLPTKPDTTQYQLMRLMEVLRWKRVRVLNLSDLRNARSADFYNDVSAFENREGQAEHSIFSAARRMELTTALVRKSGAPVFAAWGVGRPLEDLARRALASLNAMKVVPVGLSHRHGSWAFRHPLPKGQAPQQQWRLDALGVLRPSH